MAGLGWGETGAWQLGEAHGKLWRLASCRDYVFLSVFQASKQPTIKHSNKQTYACSSDSATPQGPVELRPCSASVTCSVTLGDSASHDCLQEWLTGLLV